MVTPTETKQKVVIIQSESGVPVTIPQKSADKAPKRLGVRIAADGSWTKEKTRWKQIAGQFATKVRRAQFKRICGLKVYSAVWVAKIRFVGAIIGLTEKECDDIQKPVVQECLRASGINGNFPRDVVFGPK